MRILPNEEPPEVIEYLDAKRQYEEAQYRLNQALEVLVKTMESDQTKTYKWAKDDFTYAVTYVQTHTPIIDEAGLRKALTAKVYDRYTVKKLDKVAMEKAMTAGVVDPIVVSKFVTERLGKPYVKVTVTENKRENA